MDRLSMSIVGSLNTNWDWHLPWRHCLSVTELGLVRDRLIKLTSTSVFFRSHREHSRSLVLCAPLRDFELIIFTASFGFYANVILDVLDPTHQLIHHRVFREHCV